MQQDEVRAMVIKCHSGFVHYNMFHNNHSHGGGNNYGSIFNITNNCSGGTGFWGGLGAGLGFGLGNMFGGLFGNMFGGFGMGNMFGMGNLWGGGAGNTGSDYSRYASNRSSCNCKCGNKDDKDLNNRDIDNPKFKSITDKMAKLTAGQVSDADYNAIKAEIDAAKKATDAMQKESDEQTYDNLLKTLDELKAGKPAEVVKVDNNNGKIGGKTISDLTGDDINNITQADYDKLSDVDKEALKNKIKGLSEDDRAKLARNNQFPADLRIAAKESFYRSGYTNVSIDSLTDDEIKKLKSVIDTSPIADFKNIKTIDNIKRDDAGKLKSFKMTAQTGTAVTYVTVSVVDNELIFHGRQETQKYALQKDTDANYHLMQYKYHDGNGTADVKSR